MPLSQEERQAVQDLLIRYAFAADSGADEQTFLDLFTTDCVMDGPYGEVHGVEAVKKLAGLVKNTGGRQSRHLITNILIEGDGGDAQISAYFFRVKTPVDGRPDPVVEYSVGTYRCVARKVDGAWRLQQRLVHIEGM